MASLTKTITTTEEVTEELTHDYCYQKAAECLTATGGQFAAVNNAQQMWGTEASQQWRLLGDSLIVAKTARRKV